MIPIEYFLVLAAILFAIGAYGVITKSNPIIVLMCIGLMLNAVAELDDAELRTLRW